MSETAAASEQTENGKLRRAIRIDLVIAICALLVSTLATAASLWQSHVVAQQLGAQVWPYVAFTETFSDDTFSVGVTNDGLGPAVMRSVVVAVDGVPRRTFVDAVHALIGPHVIARAKRSEKRVGADLSSFGPGGVLRAGASTTLFDLTSRSFSTRLELQSPRMSMRACYCSIVGECWRVDKDADDPVRVERCPPERFNLLTGSLTTAALRTL